MAKRRAPDCPRCGRAPYVRVDRWDTVACLECAQWIEGPCGAATCPYCPGRPAEPPRDAALHPASTWRTGEGATIPDDERVLFAERLTVVSAEAVWTADEVARVEVEAAELERALGGLS